MGRIFSDNRYSDYYKCLGDDFFDRYMKKIKNQSKKKSKLSFEGLLPDDLIDRKKRKHQDPPVPAFYQIKAPVTLDYHSGTILAPNQQSGL